MLLACLPVYSLCQHAGRGGDESAAGFGLAAERGAREQDHRQQDRRGVVPAPPPHWSRRPDPAVLSGRSPHALWPARVLPARRSIHDRAGGWAGSRILRRTGSPRPGNPTGGIRLLAVQQQLLYLLLVPCCAVRRPGLRVRSPGRAWQGPLCGRRHPSTDPT